MVSWMQAQGPAVKVRAEGEALVLSVDHTSQKVGFGGSRFNALNEEGNKN